MTDTIPNGKAIDRVIKHSLSAKDGKLKNMVIANEKFAACLSEISKLIRGKSRITDMTERLADTIIAIRRIQLIENISDESLHAMINAKLNKEDTYNKRSDAINAAKASETRCENCNSYDEKNCTCNNEESDKKGETTKWCSCSYFKKQDSVSRHVEETRKEILEMSDKIREEIAAHTNDEDFKDKIKDYWAKINDLRTQADELLK